MAARRIILKSLLFALAGVLGLIVVAFVFHDAISRAFVLHLASRVPGLETKIEGEFDVTPAFPFIVDATGVSLEFTGEALPGSQWRIGEVHLALRLGPLLRGVAYFEELVVADANITIPPMPESVEDAPRPSIQVRIPFFEELRLERIKVQFQLAAENPTHEFSIDRLQAGMNAEGALNFEGNGALNQDPLTLAATLGNLEQFLQARDPYPVQAALRAPNWDLEASVSGTFAQPLRLSGADLDFEANAPDLSPLRDVFFPDAPFAGAADIKAHLSGDWRAMAFSDLQATVEDGEKFKLTVSGAAADFQALKGLDLTVDAVIEDATVARYLLPEDVPAVQTMLLQAGIKADGEAVRIENLDARLTGEKDLSLHVNGAIELAGTKSGWTPGDADLDVQASAAVANIKTWLPKSFPETGRVTAKTQIEGSAGSVSFTKFDVELGETEPLRGSARGEFSYSAAQIQAMRESEPSPGAFVPEKADVGLELETADLKGVGALLGQELPDVGPVAAKARLTIDNKGALRVTNVNARTHGKRPLSIAATGQLTVADAASKPSVHDVDLKLQASGPNAEAGNRIVEWLPVDPGPWSLTAGIMGPSGNKLRVETFAFESGNDDTVRLEVDGTIGDLNQLLTSAGKSPAGVSFKGRLTAASTEHLGKAAGRPIPNFGRLSASFEGGGDKEDWSLSSADVAIADDTGLDVKLKGKATGLLSNLKLDATVALKAPDLQKTMARMGANIRPVSAVTAEGRLTGDRKLARFDGRIDVGKTPIDMQLQSDLTKPKAHLAGTMRTPLLGLGDLLGPDASANGTRGEAETSSEGAPEPAGITDPLLLSDYHIPFEYLRLVDLDLQLIAEQVQGERVRTERFHFELDTGDDRHHAHMHDLKFEGGSASMRLQVDLSTDPPKVTVNARASNISMGAVHAQLSDSPTVTEGLLSFNVDLTGTGRSPHELAATSNGSFGNVVENAKLAGQDVDILAFDTLNILTGTLFQKRETTIECMIADFNVKDGVATTETMYFHTPKMLAAANGQFNFADETMDLVVNTQAKTGLFKKKTALRIHGPMREPKVDADIGGAAAGLTAETAVTYGMFAVPMIGLPVAGLSFLGGLAREGEKTPCAGETTAAKKP